MGHMYIETAYMSMYVCVYMWMHLFVQTKLFNLTNVLKVI